MSERQNRPPLTDIDLHVAKTTDCSTWGDAAAGPSEPPVADINLHVAATTDCSAWEFPPPAPTLTLTFRVPADVDRVEAPVLILGIIHRASQLVTAQGGGGLSVAGVARDGDQVTVTLTTPDGPGAADRLRRARDEVNQSLQTGPSGPDIQVRAELAGVAAA